MKLQRILAGVLLLFCFSVSKAETSQNLIDPQAWDGATYGTDPGGCCASISGSGAMIDNTTQTIMFSYGRDVLAQTIAINQALALSGISVDGYQYEWTYRLIGKHGSDNYYQVHNDTLQFIVTVKDANGNLVERYVYDRSGAVGQTIAGSQDWQTESGTELFKQSYQDPQNIQLQIIGADGGYWSGYYGPEVKDIALRLIYSADPCSGNPLFDPSCNGYAEALAKMLYDQNCAANALYDSGCPGYQQAYFNQQCTTDALYSSACPGYAAAYFDQQCSSDALYDTSCPGYATAYYNQQCSLDALYDTGCAGYTAAYYSQQCSLDALYDSGCTGYQEAYATKMLLEQQEEETTASTIPTTEAATTVYVDPVASLTTISATGDSVVDSVLAAPVTIASSAPQLLAQPLMQEVASNEPEPESIPDSSADMGEQVDTDGDGENNGREGESSGDSSDEADGSSTESGTSDSKDDDKKESKRDKVKRAMTERAQNLANEMSEAATVEAQMAVQAAVVATMGYLPGFGTYGGTIAGGAYPDSDMYAPTTVPESRQGLRNGLAQQLLWDKLVETQYNN